ncbi:uncharacterized protein EMH_0004390 [Eimeria mitis]|uniref:SURF1-like protein n=1 Tax=Eimeria mitis TaxID=44415 RepID=U6K1J3_9EIME|nr:uncharacterized protein EMH_0004390 [Eimeria mitis]CDJ29643.1 hypothetical protein, conserved [Eimeria mitis]
MWRREGTPALAQALRSIKAATAARSPQRRGAILCGHHRTLCSAIDGQPGSSSSSSNSSRAPIGPGKAPEEDKSETSRGNDKSGTAAPGAADTSSLKNTSLPAETKAETKVTGGSPLAAATSEGGKPTAPNWGFAPIPFVASGRSMPGQRLLPCTREDAAILAKAEAKYPSPQEVEGGIIVRIIAAKDAQKVTSPVLRVVRNRQYGIRKGERLRLALGGAFFSGVLAALGFWQLQRMHEKQEVIEYRRSHLARQPTVITASPFPWTLDAAANASSRAGKQEEGLATESSSTTAEASSEPTAAASLTSKTSPSSSSAQGAAAAERQRTDASAAVPEHSAAALPERPQENEREVKAAQRKTQRSGRLLAEASVEDVEKAVREWAYTPVVLHGVLDSSTELLVGPRPGLEMGNPGYCVVSPLRLEDGSVILVNKGHLPFKLARLPPFPSAVDEETEFYTVRQRQPPQHQNVAEEQHVDAQLGTMQQQRGKQKYVHYGAQQYAERLQQVAGSRMEPVGSVTVRGVLEPGEVANSSFKMLMLKNRPHDGQFTVLHPGDLVEATPGIPNRREAALLMVNAYSIVYDEDVLHPPSGGGGELKVANRFISYEQKKKDDYLLFYADEHTHFNYACQWFLMGLCTAAMTVYKIIEVSKWRW